MTLLSEMLRLLLPIVQMLVNAMVPVFPGACADHYDDLSGIRTFGHYSG